MLIGVLLRRSVGVMARKAEKLKRDKRSGPRNDKMEERVRAMERDDRLLSDAQRVKGHAYLLSLELERAVQRHAQWSGQ